MIMRIIIAIPVFMFCLGVLLATKGQWTAVAIDAGIIVVYVASVIAAFKIFSGPQ